MPTSKSPVNFDDVFEDEEGDAPVETMPVEVLGETFTMVRDVNAFQIFALGSGDEEAMARAVSSILLNAVIPEDRARWVAHLGSIQNFTAKKVIKLFERIVEVAASDRPTTSSPASRRTTPKKVATKRSAVRSYVKGSTPTR